MGRGRQKAKQTKVARELKYFSPATNYHALESELRGTAHAESAVADRYAADDDEDDETVNYSAWIDDDEDEKPRYGRR
jgi:hypothetical protein